MKSERYNFGSILGLMTSLDDALTNKRKFSIAVEPKTELSKELALWAYKSLREKDWQVSHKPEFDCN